MTKTATDNNTDKRVKLSPIIHSRLKRYAKKHGYKLSPLADLAVKTYLDQRRATERAAREAQQ